MFRTDRGYGGDEGFLGLPPMISQLVLINVGVYLAQNLLPVGLLYEGIRLVPNGVALVPSQVLTKGMVWELVTYAFLHGSFWHLFWNMFGLVIFGSDLERWWGSREFLKYYLVTAVGAGVVHLVSAYLLGEPRIPVVGASGAIFGILIAFALAFPNRRIYWMMLVPIPARTLVAIYALIELFSAAGTRGDNVARFAHLGGMLVGFLYLKQDKLLWRGKRWMGRLGTTVRQAREPRAPGGESPDGERVDEILAKIKSQGMGALTDEERRILHDAAERARRKQRGESP